ncbi:ABCG5-like protein [Mya arenaria]|uniref:ABCG5-like protein n=1 Tax=Mya arenaria TaxID=6604 RepID=A0ABY7FGA5_MYAAR|nr:ABCG5-like protein [Mya arenaria]
METTTSALDIPVNYILGRCTFANWDEEDEPANTTLSILNVSYVVKERVGPWWKGACLRRIRHKLVLRDVCMHMRSGQINAILGGSGSGKTSLLDCIAQRAEGTMSGKVYYNNSECTPDLAQNFMSYVMQADRLLPNLTVREALRYSAQLRLPGNASNFDIEEKVSKVIIEMGLKNVADHRIGGSVIRGISGGEKRRVTIATQLLQNPKILLLDEPTSGLDSFTARSLMASLANLAHQGGKIVLLTIHQPRSEIFRMFDQELGYPCPTYTNPTDFYVDMASVDRRDNERNEESSGRVKELTDAYAASMVHKDVVYEIIEDTMKPTTGRQLFAQKFTHYRPQKSSFFRTLFTLLGRMTLNVFRDRASYLSRVFLLSLFVPFICVFLGRLGTNQTSVQDRIGLLYQSSQVPTFVAALNAIGLFPPLRDLYYREGRDGLYGCTTFLLAYILHILPFTVISTAIFCSVPHTDHFLHYCIIILFMHLFGEIMSVLLMGAFMNTALATSNASIILSASGLMASGFLRNLEKMLPVFQWAAWGNIFKYAGEILAANEFHNLKLNCKNNGTFCFTSGDAYLALVYPEAVDNMTRNFWAVTGFTSATFICVIAVFKIRGIPNLS